IYRGSAIGGVGPGRDRVAGVGDGRDAVDVGACFVVVDVDVAANREADHRIHAVVGAGVGGDRGAGAADVDVDVVKGVGLDGVVAGRCLGDDDNAADVDVRVRVSRVG